jgi:hypothetical protein
MTAQATAQRLITFDAPDGGTGPYQGTTPLGINLNGTITGIVTDSSNGTHGFVGRLKRAFTNFDAPGADPVAGGTSPNAINDFDVITGVSVDSNYVEHGFVRTPDGTITVFDVPGAGSVPGSYQGTYSASINDLGEAVGYYLDANYTAHGFLRAANGKITTFDDPAAGSGVYQGTWPNSINDFGVIVGATTYSDNSSHGLLRTKNGSYPDFQFPSPTDYNTAFINDRGVIAGSYAQAPFTDFVGYQRTPDGRMTVFEAPGSGATTTYSYEGTWMNALNLQGTTTGYVQSADVESNSFIREANGKITVFELPGQAAVPGNYTGSGGFAINAAGVVTGKWYDANLAIHGFLRLPN